MGLEMRLHNNLHTACHIDLHFLRLPHFREKRSQREISVVSARTAHGFIQQLWYFCKERKAKVVSTERSKQIGRDGGGELVLETLENISECTSCAVISVA